MLKNITFSLSLSPSLGGGGDSSVLGQVPMADFSEHCKDSAGFINNVEFFGQMNW
jgi:hypothetical protein